MNLRRAFSLAVWVVVGTLTVVLGGTALAQSINPEVGIWKLNVAKSKGSPGTGNKSGTVKIEAVGSGIKIIADLVSNDGTMSHYEFTTTYDGKDNPVVGNSPYGGYRC